MIDKKSIVTEALKYEEEVNEDDYEIYEPLLAGLKDYQQSASFQNLWFILRRIVLITSVIVLADNYW